MTRDDVIRMAREADLWLTSDERIAAVERFAALVAAAEREACKALHELDDVLARIGNGTWGESYQQGWTDGTWAYLQAIRARGET
jgi:hypothetical protein